MTSPVLHILGCGRAARAIARRLVETGVVEMGQIVNRSRASAGNAAAFIGAGTPVTEFDRSLAGGWLLLGLPDGELIDIAAGLENRLPARPELAFHLSGSVSASALAPLCVPAAAVHPVRAFSDPAAAADGFEATWCVAEGDDAALQRLRPAFEAAGGRWLVFRGQSKVAYHAATVAASNFLVTVNALARDIAIRAGFDEPRAAELLGDLQQGTLADLTGGPAAQSLTGPIERGDVKACLGLRQAVADSLPPAQAELFNALARATLDLAVQKRGRLDSDEALAAVFADRVTSPPD